MLTYIYDQNYYNEFGKELDGLFYDFTQSHFTGFFITSRLDGTMLLGRRIEDGTEIFEFRQRSRLAPQMQESEEVHDSLGLHLFLHLNNEGVVTRSALSNFEDDSSLKCSFCGKSMEDCTCIEILYCSKCGKKIKDGKCGCPDKDENAKCAVCGSEIINGNCKCIICPLCGMKVCICSPSGGNTGGGGNSGGGGDNGGGGNIGGGNTGGPQPAIPGTAAVKNAADAAVKQIIREYGTEDAACNSEYRQHLKKYLAILIFHREW